MRVEFTRTLGRFAIREGVVRGPVIGATVDGHIDYMRDDVRMRGTFVPLYGLNNMFGQIPIFGLFLGGSNEGLLGVTYEVVGPPGAPVLRVNPISAVAPGLLRKFFEFPTTDRRHADLRPAAELRRSDPAISHTGFSSTWRFRPSESLMTPSGVSCARVSTIFSSVTAASLTLQAAALDLAARFAVRADQAGPDEGGEHADARLELGARDLDRRQRLRERAFLEGAARGLGGFVGGGAAVHQRGRLGRQHLLGLVDLLALERGQPADLVERQHGEQLEEARRRRRPRCCASTASSRRGSACRR